MLCHNRYILTAAVLVFGVFSLASLTYAQSSSAASGVAAAYNGQPFHDQQYSGGPQTIPGKVQCAYYDFGGEGVAYHDTDAVNHGSGELNPLDGSYLNGFRVNEAVDISYVKVGRQPPVDDNPYNLVVPPPGQLYVGWTHPGEWFNLTVQVAKAGRYTVDLLYTSQHGGEIGLDLGGRTLASPLKIQSTASSADPLAWRQWHHWNMAKKLAEVELPEGLHVLTVHIVTEGDMNLAYFDFRSAQK
jgi:hypothetical protein